MGERGAVVSKQQFSDEYPDGFRACEETPKVEQTAVYLGAGVDASGRSSASRSMMLKKMENNVGARAHPCLTLLEMGKLPRQ